LQEVAHFGAAGWGGGYCWLEGRGGSWVELGGHVWLWLWWCCDVVVWWCSFWLFLCIQAGHRNGDVLVSRREGKVGRLVQRRAGSGLRLSLRAAGLFVWGLVLISRLSSVRCRQRQADSLYWAGCCCFKQTESDEWKMILSV
jgi:hypothetical protein